jgi:hypothetical protein
MKTCDTTKNCWFNEKGNILVRTALTVIETKEEKQEKEQKFKDPSFISLFFVSANTGPLTCLGN